MKKIFATAFILFAGVQAASAIAGDAQTTNFCAPAKLPVAHPNFDLDNAFAGLRGPGWIGGDSGYSTLLPDGRLAFTFSDTFIGIAYSSGSSRISGMPRNSELVGTLGAMTSNYNGDYYKPESLIPDSNSGLWYWTFATYSENGEQLIYLNEFNNENMFGKFSGVSAIATMAIPKGKLPQLSGVTILPFDLQTSWGRAHFQEGGYHYIFGHYTPPPGNKFVGMKLARVPVGHSTELGKWEYWNGKGWSNAVSDAVPFYTTNELDGVMPEPKDMGTGYMAVSIPNGVFADTTFDVSFACAPQGPWSIPMPVYTLPEITGKGSFRNEIAYLPTVHPELNKERAIIASYSINTTKGLEAYQDNIHIYQPRFLTLNY